MCKPSSNLCISLPGSIHASNNKITCHVQATLLPRREDRSIIAHIQTIVVCLVAAWPSRQQHSPGHPQLRGVAHQGSFP